MSDNLETLMFLMGKNQKHLQIIQKILKKKKLFRLKEKNFDYNKLDKDISDF